MSLQDDIKAAAQKSVTALKDSLVTLLKMEESNALALAQNYAEDAVEWGANLTNAKLAGDTEAISQYEEDFKEIAVAAALEAASLGINIESSTEGQIKAILGTFGTVVGASLLAL